jgi:phosphotransferase system enzyme I (PtsI)
LSRGKPQGIKPDFANKLARDYSNLPGAYLPQLAADINDVASRVFVALTGQDAAEAWVQDDIILAAKEVQPSMTVRFKNRIRGILSETGGATSLAAILAKTPGIPGISGCRLDENIANGTLVIIDVKNCSVTVNPDSQTQPISGKKCLAGRKKKLALKTAKNTVTTDGVKDIYIYTRQHRRKAGRARSRPVQRWRRRSFAYRISLSVQSRCPGLGGQSAGLKEIPGFFPHDSVTIRTIDIGGDKPLPGLIGRKKREPSWACAV